jgi:hypothetical protein
VEAIQEIIDISWNDTVKNKLQGRQQEQLMSFFTGQMTYKVLKIATQRAVLKLKDTITKEDFQYALEVCKINIQSVRKLLAKDVYSSSNENKKDQLFEVIKSYGKTRISRPDLWKGLQDGTWDFHLGENNMDTYLKELEKEGKIASEIINTGKARAKSKIFKAISDDNN